MARKQPQKGAGRKDTGNVVVDLGEDIDKVINSAARGAVRKEIDRTEMGRPGDRPGTFGGYRPGGYRPGGYRPGGYRPGMFGGYRPWYADREGRMGSSGGAFLGMAWLDQPIKPAAMLGGLALGVIGNRALVRVTPDIIGTSLEIAHTGIAFVVGLIPVLARPNSITVGVALPGAVYFAGSLVDWAMNKIGIKKPQLSGIDVAAPRQGIDAALAARQKLADIQSKMQPQTSYAAPRVVAHAQ